MAVTITDSNFKEFTSTGVAVVDVKAEWCGPCKAIAPIIEELSNEYGEMVNESSQTIVRIGKLDADESSDTARELGIRSIPTILIFKDGEIVERHTGMIQKKVLKSLIDKHLV